MDRSIVLDTTNKYTIADWVVVKEIGVGNSSNVKMVYDPTRNAFAALKVLSKTASRREKQAFENEANLLRKLNHPNLINIIDSYIDIECEDEHGKNSQLTALALELASNGELYEFLAKTGRFDEKIARIYFRQLINALEYCHKKGIAHRDIKPENILLDSEYNLKIADFGLARPLNDARRSALVATVGSEGYAAPELLTQGSADGRKVDIFAAGVVLFLILAGNPPFARADFKDPCYKLLCSGKENLFWEQQEKRILKENNEEIFSKGLRDLLNAMLAIDPEDRPTIEEIKANPWFNGVVATPDELKSELERRSVIVQSLLNQVVLNKQDLPNHTQNSSDFSKRASPPQPIQTTNLTMNQVNNVPVLTNNEEAAKEARETSLLNLLSPSLPNISLN